MKLLVIVVTYNAINWTERCFGSLYKSTLRPDVFVIDNGSTDGTQAFVKKHYPDVIFHQSDHNLGFGKANNLGLQYALDYDYEYVYLLNQDAWVMPDTFERLVFISKQYPEYGILSPFQMNADMVHIDRNFFANVMVYESNPEISSDMYNQKLQDLYPVSGVMAAHWFLPIGTIKKVGGFSPTFPHYAEDGNYIDRVHFWGLKVGVVPSLRVVHDRGRRKDSDEKKMYLDYTSSLYYLSNPLKSNSKSFFIIAYNCFGNVIVYKSFKPLQYLLKIVFNICWILKNKKTSINQTCAFLNCNSVNNFNI